MSREPRGVGPDDYAALVRAIFCEGARDAARDADPATDLPAYLDALFTHLDAALDLTRTRG